MKLRTLIGTAFCGIGVYLAMMDPRWMLLAAAGWALISSTLMDDER